MRNPSLLKSKLHWIIRDQLFQLGTFFVTVFLDDLLGLGDSAEHTALLCLALL